MTKEQEKNLANVILFVLECMFLFYLGASMLLLFRFEYFWMGVFGLIITSLFLCGTLMKKPDGD